METLLDMVCQSISVLTVSYQHIHFLFTFLVKATLYSGRTKYGALLSKLNKLKEKYLSPQKTQKAAGFFYSKDLGQENDLKS